MSGVVPDGVADGVTGGLVGAFGCIGAGFEGRELRLIRLGGFPEHYRKQLVEKIDQLRGTPVVCRKVDTRVLPVLRGKRTGDIRSQPTKHRHICTTKPVNRLLLITDEKELSRINGSASMTGIGKEKEQVPLGFVVVLKLVDHDKTKLVCIEAPKFGVFPQQPNGQFHHFLVSNQARCAPLRPNGRPQFVKEFKQVLQFRGALTGAPDLFPLRKQSTVPAAALFQEQVQRIF